MIKLRENISGYKIENIKSKTTDNFGNLKERTHENSEIIEAGGPVSEKALRFEASHPISLISFFQSYETTIKTLQSTLRKEQKRVRELKSLYVKEIESKNEMEKILRKCIDDIKDEMLKIKAENRVANLKALTKENTFGKEQREVLIEKLLNNEKVLTIIYDKTFYCKNEGDVELPNIEEKGEGGAII